MDNLKWYFKNHISYSSKENSSAVATIFRFKKVLREIYVRLYAIKKTWKLSRTWENQHDN